MKISITFDPTAHVSVIPETKTPRRMNRGGVAFGRGSDSSTRRHFEPGADVRRDLRRVVIDEVTDAVMRDAPELGPVAERCDGRFFVLRENPAAAQADDVRELIL